MSRVEPRPMITKVWARNFRSVEFAELELGDLTVLVGPNASGKSNLVDILRFLSDAARDGLAKAIERRGGIAAFGHRPVQSRVLAPEIGLQLSLEEGTLEYSFALASRRGGGYEVKRECAALTPIGREGGPYRIEIENRRLSEVTIRSMTEEGTTQEEVNRRKNTSALLLASSLIQSADGQSLLLIPVDAVGISAHLLQVYTPKGYRGDEPALQIDMALRAMKHCLQRISLYQLFPSPLRDPQRAAEGHPLATGGENLGSTLRSMILDKNRFFPDLKEALAVAVPGIRDIRVSKAGSHHVVKLRHDARGGSGNGPWFDLSRESDGTIRLLAMLTALFQDPAPSLMGLEEPELAIHPGAMAVLADNMNEASLRGQVLISTHSPELINLFPIESIRAVSAEDGITRVGRVAEHQMNAVKEDLFSPGELHSMQGLHPAV